MSSAAFFSSSLHLLVSLLCNGPSAWQKVIDAMSFGYSISDFVALVQIAHKTYRNCQKAGPEYVEIARETRSLHSVLKILRTESKSSESIVFKQDAGSAAELLSIMRGCETVLGDIDGTLTKYTGLDPQSGAAGAGAGAGKKLWHKIRFGSKIDELKVIRGKLIAHTSTLAVLLDTMQLKATGQLGTQMKMGFAELKNDFEAMREQVLATIIRERAKHRYGSLLSLSSLSTYDGDNKETWIEFRRELISKGFWSQTLDRHKDVLISYMMKLEKSGILDKASQASSTSDPQHVPWWTKHMFMETINSLPDLELPEIADPESKVATTRAARETGKVTGSPPAQARISTSLQQGTYPQANESSLNLAGVQDAGPGIAIDASAKQVKREQSSCTWSGIINHHGKSLFTLQSPLPCRRRYPESPPNFQRSLTVKGHYLVQPAACMNQLPTNPIRPYMPRLQSLGVQAIHNL